MMTYARFFRRQMWILAVASVVLGVANVFLYGREMSTTIIGWFVSVVWTAILFLEGCAFIAERYRPESRVSRTTSRISIAMMIIVIVLFDLPLAFVTMIVFTFHPGPDMQAYYVDALFGGTYLTAAVRAMSIVASWGCLNLYGLSVRKMFSPVPIGQTTSSRWIIGFLALILFIAGLSIPAATSEAFKTLGNLPASVRFQPHWQFQIAPSFAMVASTLFLCVGAWSLAQWVTTSSTMHTVAVFILAALVWIAPFVYGIYRYGPGLRQLNAMEHVYMMVTVCIPLLLWGFHLLLKPRTKAAELKG